MECGCVVLNLLLLLFSCSVFSVAVVRGQETKRFPLLMPNVVPRHKDSYLCTAVRMDPTEDYFITAYEPNSTMEIAHHMILTGCSEPGSTEEVWSCGDMASKELGKDLASPCSKNSQIMYAWAKDAPKLVLPEGVGFKIGGNTDIQYLVLQVHYASVEKFKDGYTDDSGIFLHYTKTPLPKVAGVLLMGTGGRILPHSIEYMETACTINENIVIHPFAFRTHTHSLGRVVSGYKIEMKDREAVWTLLGKKDPQLPQMFYNIPEDMTLSKGDLIAARCTMESNRDRVTRIGSTANDEMCNFYIMYWKEDKATNAEIPKHCFSMGPPYFYWDTIGLKNIPEDASTLPVEERANEINSF
ncbi:UNVERIFIED_CONTAM: hypothetical protein RMT77_002005 [Armadillidium vulgare]